ncbi:MAG TPA: gluconate 2-dehydrogenase subunit 3 family protein [Terriglobales bacterium]|nr:gluconate 2-dehydrogenase subunit 3 family protein [Terriglobales bacterium]
MDEPHSSRREFLVRSLSGVSSAWLALQWPAVLAAHEHARMAASSSSPAAFQFLSAEQAIEVDAAAAQIIPADDTPGAHEAHVVYFVDRALVTFDRDKQPNYTQGLKDLQAKVVEMFPQAGKFSALEAAQQVKVLQAIEHSEFFELLRLHTIMGFLASPEYGGNYQQIGWNLIGFENKPVYSPPFGYYDAEYDKGH